MTVDEPHLAPPPPSGEAVQLAELRRAELLSLTRSQVSPWWMPIVTGLVFAAEIWSFTQPESRRLVVMMSVALLGLAVQIGVQRANGIRPQRIPRSLSGPSYWTFSYLAVGGVGLVLLWRVAPWPVVAALGFLLGASAQLLMRHKMAVAVERVEADALAPPSEASR